MRDAADLNTRAIMLETLLEPSFDRAIVAFFVHIDEVNDDQSGEIAQAQLPGNLVGRLQIGFERGVLDMMLAGRAPGIDVDRYQGLGLVEHDITA